MIKIYENIDCIEGMQKHWDFLRSRKVLAIVDPPYFSGQKKKNFYGKQISTTGVKRKTYKPLAKSWQPPKKEYFSLLDSITKNQIIWGCNYYKRKFGPGRIIWDKVNGNTSYSDCEIAYCSLHDSVRLFRYMWNGMFNGKSIDQGWIQEGNKKLNEDRIHPTQKPVNLYRWLVREYVKGKFDLVLDTHVGSGSSLIAYEEAEIEYVAFELDPYYFNESTKRIEEWRKQKNKSNLDSCFVDDLALFQTREAVNE